MGVEPYEKVRGKARRCRQCVVSPGPIHLGYACQAATSVPRWRLEFRLRDIGSGRLVRHSLLDQAQEPFDSFTQERLRGCANLRIDHMPI